MITKSTIAKAKRYDFLFKNKKRWEGIVSWTYTVPSLKEKGLVKSLAKEMKSTGLYSKKTYIGDIERSVVKYIHIIRRSYFK